MLEVTAENAADYLRSTGRVDAKRRVTAKALGWGVSNVVVRVDIDGELPLVLKQARERLRTKAHWVSRLDRIWTERDALNLLDTILPEGTVPRIVFADEDNYLFAMTCAPDDSVVWKEQLLSGHAELSVAHRAGELLSSIHRSTLDHPSLSGRLSDTTVFHELRVDPFYREIARVHPAISPQIDTLIASMSSPKIRCLVLGDFSPKNILVHSHGLTLVDFETAHAGDPSYDVGFCLSHLWLKSFQGTRSTAPIHEFQRGYLPHSLIPIDDPSPAFWHMVACSLARIDGKSPVDYLDDDARTLVRSHCLSTLSRAPS